MWRSTVVTMLALLFVAAAPADAERAGLPRGRVLFAYSGPKGDGLFTVRPDGSEKIRVDKGMISEPEWAPGHDRVAYLKRMTDGIYLWVAEHDGTDSGMVARVDDPNGYPYESFEWSPDGSRIAFEVRSGAGLTADIFVVDADRSGLRSVTSFPGSEEQPSWSPDGERLAFSGVGLTDLDPEGTPNGIFTIAVDGSDLEQITHHQGDIEPAWSPDGTKIAFNSYRDDCCYTDPDSDGPYTSDLYVVGAEGNDERRLTDDCHFESHLVWLVDSSGLIYGAADDDDGCWRATDSEIRFVGLDGSTRNLTRNRRGDFAPSLSPNGRWFAYQSYGRRENNHDPEIHIRRLFGTTTYRLTDNGSKHHDFDPSW